MGLCQAPDAAHKELDAAVAKMFVFAARLLAGQAGEPATPANTDRDIVNSVGMRLVLIPAGDFLMGSPKEEVARRFEEHAHRVRITKSFWLGGYEVTQAEYSQVMGINPRL